MDAERFEQLAEAYGGDLNRWPEAERDAAQAFAEVNGHAPARVLAEARRLDAALDAVPAPAASDLLRARIISAAPRPAVAWIGFGGRSRWTSWAGLAAACAAGVIVGAAAMDRVTTGTRADLVLAANESGGWMDSYANIPEAR